MCLFCCVYLCVKKVRPEKLAHIRRVELCCQGSFDFFERDKSTGQRLKFRL